MIIKNVFKQAFVKSDKKFLKVLNEVYKDETGIDAGCVTSTGGTYAQAMPNIVTWGPTFPGTKDTCHEENECMSEEVLEKIYKLYSEALKKLALSEQSYLQPNNYYPMPVIKAKPKS